MLTNDHDARLTLLALGISMRPRHIVCRTLQTKRQKEMPVQFPKPQRRTVRPLALLRSSHCQQQQAATNNSVAMLKVFCD